MTDSFKAQDGKTIKDGDEVEIVLLHGEQDVLNDLGNEAGHYERTLSGVVEAFEQDGELHWEVKTDDPQHPAIGIVPENVLTRLSS